MQERLEAQAARVEGLIDELRELGAELERVRAETVELREQVSKLEKGMADEKAFDSLRDLYPTTSLRELGAIPGSKVTFMIDPCVPGIWCPISSVTKGINGCRMIIVLRKTCHRTQRLACCRVSPYFP